jgi:hypothetical protein
MDQQDKPPPGVLTEEQWAQIAAIASRLPTTSAGEPRDYTINRAADRWLRDRRAPSLADIFQRARQAMLPALREEAQRLGLHGHYDDQGRWWWIHWAFPEKVQLPASLTGRGSTPPGSDRPTTGTD